MMDIRIDLINNEGVAGTLERQKMKEKIGRYFEESGLGSSLACWDYCEVAFQDFGALIDALQHDIVYEKKELQPTLKFGSTRAKLVMSMNYESNIYIKDHL